MVRAVRHAASLVAALAVISSVLSGCGRAPDACPEPAPHQAANVVLVPIRVEGGRVVARPVEGAIVPLGSAVVIAVISDVSDVVYVHGYECGAQVRAGDAGVFSFIANKPGVFEVELEDTNFRVQLQVR